jgi:hypothetical protein
MPMANANTVVPAQAHADTLARQVRLTRPANWNSMSRKARKIGWQNKQSTETRRPWPNGQKNALSFLLRSRPYNSYTVPRPPPRPRRRKHVQEPTSTPTAKFIFLVLPSPPSKKRGRGGVEGAQRARGNDINTARQIGFAPADLLYSE